MLFFLLLPAVYDDEQTSQLNISMPNPITDFDTSRKNFRGNSS